MTQKTATETLKDREDWQDERSVHRYMEQFTEKWMQADREMAAEFQADFLSVVQAIHRDSARPMHDALAKAFSLMPPMIFPKSQ